MNYNLIISFLSNNFEIMLDRVRHESVIRGDTTFCARRADAQCTRAQEGQMLKRKMRNDAIRE